MPDSLKRGLRCCDSRCIARKVTSVNVQALRTGQNIRKLVKDGFVIRKPQKIHSRSRARAAQEAKSKGRHTGYGTLHSTYTGTACARRPAQIRCNSGWVL